MTISAWAYIMAVPIVVAIAITTDGTWSTISNGGVIFSQDYPYAMDATVGQFLSGRTENGYHIITGGFICGFAVSCCKKGAGDANNDGKLNSGDAVYIISYIFRGGPPPPCLAEANANGDLTPQGANKINSGDAVYIISYIFRGGPAPVCGI